MAMVTHIFVGPTLPQTFVKERYPEMVIHPPIAHGDILSAGLVKGDTVVIIDGIYHQHPAIRHKEILFALQEGVRVIGAASIGALRAADLASYGMIGVGRVYEAFRDGLLISDDEVAVAHTSGPDWRQITVPLVDIRWYCERASREFGASSRSTSLLLHQARSIHYSFRTWQLLVSEACNRWPVHRDVFKSIAQLASDSAPAVKALDACQALEIAEESDYVSPPQLTTWKPDFLATWRAEFSSPSSPLVGVSNYEIYKFTQLFDAALPHELCRVAKQRIDDNPDTLLRAGLVATNEEGDEGWGYATLALDPRFIDDLERVSIALNLLSAADKQEIASAILASRKFPRRLVGHAESYVLLGRLWRVSSNVERDLQRAARVRGFTTLDEASRELSAYIEWIVS